MSRREDYESRAEALILPLVEAAGFELVDVEYVKEVSDWYLRAYIDKEGGITVDDCEAISRKFSELLDREDFIEDAYIMEVSSPGLLRPLKKDKDFQRYLGKPVEFKTFKPVDGCKEFCGVLDSFNDSEIVIADEEDNKTNFERKNISIIRPYIEF